ncbi:hypothetical protein MPL3356_210012 [Mesorhizobium plurifarium]|uniref:Uncharacterized protein n=1 Tax=Mesorhizobium plurifarium TaxID=69974 RepID=A0A090DPI5_MESPL|nr:hypothetical protein MPL3356_210012 [Mesorhizobium plurifarium]
MTPRPFRRRHSPLADEAGMFSRTSEHLLLSANESFIWVAYAKVNRQSLGQRETHRLFGEIGRFAVSRKRRNALSLSFYAIPDGKPLTPFLELLLAGMAVVDPAWWIWRMPGWAVCRIG